ncbi:MULTISPECIES: VCBS repeat-containing protein [unclassified Leptolyngbya]|uniref:FG-GAP repeat domain-containing protein n=1 Tax=unclassified Leptolyngbya TaxID=2650499 RepID=UPI001685F7B3|nr:MULTISPECIES: VCBS repeat-containing protein [unclassified Leptolyngbya]MBD1911907.1 VCBS repeat-containing protein [Leptolyngbya sp. FACHB-8]MBD2156116.1 VCBS repeat-containing protein [Leptolyngbya sp. FACHB-16]
MASYSNFGNLTRNAIRFFTGNFTGDGHTDILFYSANDHNWWLGRSNGSALQWSHVGNTAGFVDLTRNDIRFFTGDFTGDGRTDILFYFDGDHNWWLGRSDGGTLQWSHAGNTAGFVDLTRNDIRLFTGDFTGDGRTDILFYFAGDHNWWLGRSDGGTLQWSHAGNTAVFVDLTRNDIRLFTGDFTGDGRTDILFYFAGDHNWWLGRSDGGTLQWSHAGNTAGFVDLTRNDIRLFTGDFTGDGRTDILFYFAGDHNWWLGRSDGGTLQWSHAGNTAGFVDLTRSDIRLFTGDFTGDGRTDILFYFAGDHNWWLGRSDGSTLQWAHAGNTSGFQDLTRPSIRFLTGNFTADGRTDVLFYCADDGNWWLGSSNGQQLQWSLVGNTGGQSPQLDRFDNLGRVYWAARDLANSPLGNHHFLSIIFNNQKAADFIRDTMQVDYLTEEKDGQTYYFMSVGGFANGLGDRIYCEFNEKNDIHSIREYIDPKEHVRWYSPDLDYEGHYIPPLPHWNSRQQIQNIIRAAKNFQAHSPIINFNLYNRNCATFANSLLASLGYSRQARKDLGQFQGVDWGEENTLDLSYFQSVQVPEAMQLQ